MTSLQQKPQGKRRNAAATLPEYLEPEEVVALIERTDYHAKVLMLLQWRAGLRVSEALALAWPDLYLDSDKPTLRVRNGKGGKARMVPVHEELAQALTVWRRYGRHVGRLYTETRSTAWRWVKEAYERAVEFQEMPSGRQIGNHTLRHSCARHWLASGIPINIVQRWLGHSSMQTTLIYLEILPDPLGDINRVP